MSGYETHPAAIDTYIVVVRTAKPALRRRIAEKWNSGCLLCILWTFAFFAAIFLTYGLPSIMGYCHTEPCVSIDSWSVRNLFVYQNSTQASSPWQVDSALSLNLSTKNPNTVAGCFTSLRRVLVRVEYRGQSILQQEVALGFGLAPRRRRSVAVSVASEHAELRRQVLGPVMVGEVGSGRLSLDVFLDTRYLRNDRKAKRVKLGCRLSLARFPSENSRYQYNQTCYS